MLGLCSLRRVKSFLTCQVWNDKSIKKTFFRGNEIKVMTKEVDGFGWCEYHEEVIEEGTYEYKGCWGCHYFVYGKNFPYYFVKEVAEMFNVTESTVRRWIRQGKLEGILFEQIRYTGWTPAPRKYHIPKESLEEFRENIKRRKK